MIIDDTHVFLFSLVITPDLGSIMDSAQLKVDVRKYQEACENLTQQLMESDESRTNLEKQVEDLSQDLSVARKTKEQSLTEKEELTKKLQVLTDYFNKRESDLQKELGTTFCYIQL